MGFAPAIPRNNQESSKNATYRATEAVSFYSAAVGKFHSALDRRGGFAITYLASDQQLHDRRVVVKMLTNTQSDDYLQRKFEEEIFALSRLVHPNIVMPLDSGRTSANQSFFVMQFVEGKTLRELIKSGTLTLRTAIEITKQLGDALAFAHSNGVVHRDVKDRKSVV